ncbi:hypothetical protein ACFTZF_47025 [Streptomyces mirabilis]|uniref:hypothetical protein n=1 Tax=Streptomyces mirabilis TaxID=68239 RepID=UPI00362F8E41
MSSADLPSPGRNGIHGNRFELAAPVNLRRPDQIHIVADSGRYVRVEVRAWHRMHQKVQRSGYFADQCLLTFTRLPVIEIDLDRGGRLHATLPGATPRQRSSPTLGDATAARTRPDAAPSPPWISTSARPLAPRATCRNPPRPDRGDRPAAEEHRTSGTQSPQNILKRTHANFTESWN